MDTFLQKEDALGLLIQAGAEDLYSRLNKIEVESLPLPSYCLEYYKTSDDVKPLDGVEEVFAWCKENGIIIGLNTGFTKNIADAIDFLKMLGDAKKVSSLFSKRYF